MFTSTNFVASMTVIDPLLIELNTFLIGIVMDNDGVRMIIELRMMMEGTLRT